MNNLLVKASIDYADEFNCEMFGVFTEDEWDEICKRTKKKLSKKGEEYEVYFGTNKQLIFASYDKWLKCFKVTEISEKEANVILNFFPDPFGTGKGAFEIGQYDGEDDSEEEQEELEN